MSNKKKISSWFGHPFLKMAESQNEDTRYEFLCQLASDLGLPKPMEFSRLEIAYIWQRAHVKAQEELYEAQRADNAAASMARFCERHFEAAAHGLGLKVAK